MLTTPQTDPAPAISHSTTRPAAAAGTSGKPRSNTSTRLQGHSASSSHHQMNQGAKKQSEEQKKKPNQPSNGPRWYSCASSELGHVRKINEDSFLDAQEAGLWVVADGMGGHSRGDRASQSIIEALYTFKPQDNALASVDDLLDRLSNANDVCRQAAQGQVMGSTVAALYLHDDNAYILWAGDSRVYRHRHGEFTQLTDDHSLVQELHRLGELTADEAENHPSSNVITRAIGVADDIEIQVRQVELEPGDRFLLCSDGLFKDVKPVEVEANLSLPSPRQALDELVKLALRRGGSDNVTAIVIQLAIA